MRTKLEEMIALTEAATCRTRSLLACFGEELAEPCGHCDNCAAPPQTVDATVEAQKVLSAVYRTDQVFGAMHIVAVLRGDTTDGVLRHGHDRLPTFGVGADHAAPYWRGLIRQLIALGALDVDTRGMAGCSWCRTRRGRSCAARRTVMLREEGRRRAEVAASGPPHRAGDGGGRAGRRRACSRRCAPGARRRRRRSTFRPM